MGKFAELLEKSVITSFVITVMVLGVTVYLFAIQAEVPPALIHMAEIILGYFLGMKGKQLIERAQSKGGR